MPEDKTTRNIRETLKGVATWGGRFASSSAKMFLASGKDLFKSSMPTLTETVELNKDLATDVFKTLTNPMDTVNRSITKAMGTESVKAIQQFAKNALDDLKSGNIYDPNRDRNSASNYIDDLLNSFGDTDWSGFDENGDWSEPDTDAALEGEAAIADIQEENASKRTAATIEAIGASTDAVTGTINANAQANIRLSVKQHAQMMTSLNNSLSVQAATLSAIDTTMKSAMEVARESHSQIMGELGKINATLEQIRVNTTPVKQEPKPYKEPDSPFGIYGGLDIRKYIKQVVKNIDNRYGVSSKATIMTGGQSIAEMLEMMGDNPWQLVSNMILNRIMPDSFRKQMTRTDRNLKNFFPALMESLAGRAERKQADGSLSIKDELLSLLGVRQSSRSTINTQIDNVSQQAAFTTRTATAIEQVIPALLSQINSSISGQPLMVFNYKTGKFERAREVFSRYTHNANDLVSGMGTFSKVMELSDAAYKFRTTAEKEDFDKYLYQFFQNKAASSTNRMINPYISKEEFKKSMPSHSKQDQYYDMIIGLLTGMDRGDLMEMASEIMEARANRDRRNYDIHNELRENGLMAAFSGLLGADLESAITNRTNTTRYGLTSDALENLEREKRQTALKHGGVQATNIILDSILGTLKSGIITYSFNVGNLADENPALSKDVVNQVMKRKSERDALDTKVQEFVNRSAETKKKKTLSEQAEAERRIRAGEQNTTLTNAYVGSESFGPDEYRAMVGAAEIKGKKAEDVESPFLKMLINEQEKVKGSVSSVLKDTGALTTFQKIAKMTQSPFNFMTETLKIVDAFMFKLIYGEDAMLDVANGATPSLMSTITRAVQMNFTAMKDWFGENIGDPIKRALFDSDKGVLPRVGRRLWNASAPVRGKITAKAGEVRDRIIGKKVTDENGNVTYEGGRFSEKINQAKSTLGNADNLVMGALNRLMYGDKVAGKGRQVTQGYAPGPGGSIVPTETREYGGVVGLFKKGFDNLGNLLFGDEYETDPEIAAQNDYSRKKFKLIKDELNKAMPDMVIGAGAGILGSLFLPGGPILGALLGSFGGLVNGSEEFKKFLFGDSIDETETYTDPKTGEVKTRTKKTRKGGIISKQVYEGVKQYAPKMGIGALIGGAAGGLGLLPFGLGPVVGAVIGSIGGMTAASKEIKKLIFGDGIDEKSGLISKEFRTKVVDTVKKYAPTSILGGLAGGAAWDMTLGLIPGLSLLPGGPIFTLLGAITGGVNEESIKKFFFGEEEETTDENGKKVKKRKGGIFGKAFDAVENKFFRPLGDKINSMGESIANWFKKDIVGPISRTVEPLKEQIGEGLKRAGASLKSIGTTITDSIKNAIGVSVDTTLGNFFREKIVKPLDTVANKIFSAIGKAIGTVVSAPFKALELIVTGRIGSDEDTAKVIQDAAGEKGIIRDKTKERVAKDVQRGTKRVRGRLGRLLDRLLGTSDQPVDTGTTSNAAIPLGGTIAPTPGYTRQGVPIEGYDTQGYVVGDVGTQYTDYVEGAGYYDGVNLPGDSAHRGLRMSFRDRARQRAAQRREKRQARLSAIQQKQELRNQKRAEHDAEVERRREERGIGNRYNTGVTSTDASRRGEADESGGRRKLGRKSNNEHLSNISKYTKRIYDEIKGQVGGVGWNTAYIRTLLTRQYGEVPDEELPEEMEGSKKKIRKRRGFLGKIRDKVADVGYGIKDFVTGKVRKARDVLDYVTEPFRLFAAAVGTAKDAILSAGSTLLSGVKKIGSMLWGAVETFGKGLSDLFLGITDMVRGAAKGLGETLGNIASTLSGVLGDLTLAVSGIASSLVRVAADIAPDIVKGLWSGFKFIGKSMFKGVTGAVGAVGNLGMKGLGWLFRKVTGREIDAEGNVFKTKKKYLGNVNIVGGTVDNIAKIDSVENIKIGPEAAKFDFPYVYYSMGKVIARPNKFAIPVYVVGADKEAKVHTVSESNGNDSGMNVDDYKNAYEKTDAAAEKSNNPVEAYDRAMRNATTESEIQAIKDAQQLNANGKMLALPAGSGEKKEEGGLLSGIIDLLTGGKGGIASKLVGLIPTALAGFATMYGFTNSGEEHVGWRGVSNLIQGGLRSLGINKLGLGTIAEIFQNPNRAGEIAQSMAQSGGKSAQKNAKNLIRFGSIADFVNMVFNPQNAKATMEAGMTAGGFKGMLQYAKGGAANLIGNAGRAVGNFAGNIGRGAVEAAQSLATKLAGTKVGSAVVGVAGNVYSSLKAKVKPIVSDLIDKLLSSKAVQSLMSKVLKKIPALKNKIMSVLFGEAFEKGVKMTGKETAESALRTVGGYATAGIVSVAFAVADFVTGWNDAFRIFNVHTNAVTIGMHVTAAVTRCLSGLLSLIPPPVGTILSVVAAFAEDPLVQVIYKLFANEKDEETLKQNQQKAAAAAEEAGMSVDEYVKKYNEDGSERGNFFQRMGKAISTTAGNIWQGAKDFGTDIINYFGGIFSGKTGSYNSKTNTWSGDTGNGPGFFGRGVKPMSQKSGKYNRHDNTMALAGCGPTAAAMVGSAYGDKRSPLAADSMSRRMGMRASDGGTNPDFFSQYAGSFGAGYGMEQGPNSASMVEGNLRKGRPVIMMGKGGKFGNNMHYLVADGVAGRGRMSFVDPLTGGRKTAGIGEMMQNTKNTVYSWGTGQEVTTAEAQQALVDKMKSIQGKIAYSLNGPQDPSQGSASCASTVGWAYKEVLGGDLAGMSASSQEQSRDNRFTDVVRLGQPGAQPGLTFDTSSLQPGDIVYMHNKWNGGSSNHTEMYIGNGQDLSHGGPDKGPTLVDLDANRQKRVFAVRRYKGFVDGELVPVTDGYKDPADISSSGEDSSSESSLGGILGAMNATSAFKAFGKITDAIGSVSNYFSDLLTKYSGGTVSSEESSDGSSAGVNDSASKSEMKNEIWKYLTTTGGFNKFAASGIMGCWNSESGNNSARLEGDYLSSFKKNWGFEKALASNDSLNRYTTETLFPAYANSGIGIDKDAYKGTDGNYYPGIGLAQWTGPRGYNLFRFAKQNGGDWRKLSTQLNFFQKESDDRGLKEVMNMATSPEDAAKLGLDHYEMYEGFADKNPRMLQERQNSARAIYNAYKDFDPNAARIADDENTVETHKGQEKQDISFNPSKQTREYGAGPGTRDANIQAMNDRINRYNSELGRGAEEAEANNATNKITSALRSGGVSDPQVVALLQAIASSMETMITVLRDIKGNTAPAKTGPTSGQSDSTSTNRYANLPVAEGTNPAYDGSGYNVGKTVIDRLTKR